MRMAGNELRGTMEGTLMTEERGHGNLQAECSLSRSDFLRLKDFIYDHCGITINEAKRTILEARLRRRLKSLGLPSLALYCDYLFSPEGMEGELTHMIDQVTTNKTDFFREPSHFDYLAQKVLPRLRLPSRRETSSSGAPGAQQGKNPIPWRWS